MERGARLIIGCGIDVVEIGRIERTLRRRGERFERRVYTPVEIRRCRLARRPALAYALGFAAKEAAMKAVATGWARGVQWTDIELLPAPDRAGNCYALELTGGARRAIERAASGGQGPQARVALSHSALHAMAWVVLEEPAQ